MSNKNVKITNAMLINYIKFLDHCVGKKEPNDFFDFQSKYLDLVTDKLTRLEKEAEKQQETIKINNKQHFIINKINHINK